MRALNYFSFASAADRYALGRPYHLHPPVMDRIAAIVSPEGPIGRALDVACGTGQSTRALAARAIEVVGADLSSEMLRHAPPPMAYVRAKAEELPFAARAFDLITVGHAFHWLDWRRFLAEASRVLRPGGWLAIYGSQFLARMVGNPDYERWEASEYSRRYPAPPRNEYRPTDAEAGEYGLRLAAREAFDRTLPFTADELVAFLLSHSSVIAAAEVGGEDIAAVADWLTASIRPMFRAEPAEFEFHCVIDMFRRQAD